MVSERCHALPKVTGLFLWSSLLFHAQKASSKQEESGVLKTLMWESGVATAQASSQPLLSVPCCSPLPVEFRLSTSTSNAD